MIRYGGTLRKNSPCSMLVVPGKRLRSSSLIFDCGRGTACPEGMDWDWGCCWLSCSFVDAVLFEGREIDVALFTGGGVVPF